MVKAKSIGLDDMDEGEIDWIGNHDEDYKEFLQVHPNSSSSSDNVFVQLICSIQYRVVKANADDAFYELQNPREQIQAYVFDVVRALVPVMTPDALFEQKGEVAKSVLEELEKLYVTCFSFIISCLVVSFVLFRSLSW